MYDIQPAYDPFLDWAKELWLQSGEENPLAFLKKCNVYPLHYGIFVSFFETGRCNRQEDILYHEIAYEQKRMMNDIINILQYASGQKPLFLLLNRIHFAQSSSLVLLHNLISRLDKCGVYMFGAYNEEYKIRAYLADDMKQLTDLLERRQLAVSMVFEEHSQEYFDSDFVPENGKLAYYVLHINNMIETGAYRQANYYLTFGMQKYQMRQFHADDADYDAWLEICMLYVRCCLYRNDTGNAARVANSIRAELSGMKNRQEMLFMLSYYVGMSHVYNNNNELADQCAAECSAILDSYDDERLAMRLLILKDINLYQGFDANNLIMDSVYADDRLIMLLKKYNFTNHLSYIYTNCMTNVISSVLKETPEDRECYEGGLRLARQNDNGNCIIVFYTNRVILASSSGRFEYRTYHICHAVRVNV